MLFIDLPLVYTTISGANRSFAIPLRTDATTRYARHRVLLPEDFEGKRLRLLNYAYVHANITEPRYYMLKVFLNGAAISKEWACTRATQTTPSSSDAIYRTNTEAMVRRDCIILAPKTTYDTKSLSMVGSDWGSIEIPQTTKQRLLEFEIWADPEYSSETQVLSSFGLWFDVE